MEASIKTSKSLSYIGSGYHNGGPPEEVMYLEKATILNLASLNSDSFVHIRCTFEVDYADTKREFYIPWNNIVFIEIIPQES